MSQLVLTEDDIPGAKLQEPYESHTVGELRWWLLCRGITVPSSVKKADIIERVRKVAVAGTHVIDVDGSYLYRKVCMNLSVPSHPPSPPITGWEVVTVSNADDMAKHLPRVMSGLLYTYLATGCGRVECQGAFQALQRGYIHWASGRLNRLEINYTHPEYCHVRCNMTPSMKDGLYHVYLYLERKGNWQR